MALIILDRDGVINHDSEEYITSPDEWHAIPGSLKAIADLTRHHYQIAVVSNQSGIGRKKFTIDDLNAIHIKMHMHLNQFGGKIDAIFFCPHTPRENCNCRKPKPGLYNQVSERMRVALNKVFCIGDKMIDIKAIQSAGGKPVLVRTGYGQQEIDAGNVPPGIPIYKNLASFTKELLAEK